MIGFRSIKQNFDSFVVYVSAMTVQPDILVLTEAWLRESEDASPFKMSG